MFLSRLSAQQRRAFFVLARRVIDADRRLALQEVERLDQLYSEAAVPAEGADAPSEVADLNLLFDTREAAVVVILDLFQLAHADGALDDRERAVIEDVATKMGVTEDLWEALQEWATRQAAQQEEARALMTAPSEP